MTVNNLPIAVLRVLSFGGYVVTAAYLLGLVKAFTAKVGKMFGVCFSLMFGVSLLWMHGWVLIAEKYDSGEPRGPVADFIAGLPLTAALIVLALLAAVNVLLWIKLQRRIRSMLTPFSLQEGLDQMSDGICFSTTDGIPLLVNKKMQDISYIAFKTGILDTVSLKRKFEEGAVRDGCVIQKRGGSTFLCLVDGSVWNLAENEIAVSGRPMMEYIAYDVTEQYQKSRELEKRNEHIAEVNKQLKEYSKNLDSVIREREILSAKIKLHDDIGRSLLALRSYLARKNGSRESLIALWRATISILKHEAVAPAQESQIETLRKAAQAVNVALYIDGNMPAQPRAEKIAALAVHECLTNTVKHAHGSELHVTIREHSGSVFLEITNNGTPPDGELEEKGGLKNLRETVEMNGGTMEIISRPQFVLKISLRKEREYE